MNVLSSPCRRAGLVGALLLAASLPTATSAGVRRAPGARDQQDLSRPAGRGEVGADTANAGGRVNSSCRFAAGAEDGPGASTEATNSRPC
jgi:hypothetical protein